MTGPDPITGAVLACPVCRDHITLGMVPAEDAAWFRARHPETKHEPPALAGRRKS